MPEVTEPPEESRQRIGIFFIFASELVHTLCVSSLEIVSSHAHVIPCNDIGWYESGSVDYSPREVGTSLREADKA